MDKLYYIVCEEKGATLFDGKFQGRTRGAAIKFLKAQIGRQSLAGVVFTVTEIPVPIIREIVGAIMKGVKRGPVLIDGFGKFRVQRRRARAGRNPRTGETIHIAPTAFPVFTAGDRLQKWLSMPHKHLKK